MFVQGENSTRFRDPEFNDDGKDAGDSGVPVALARDLSRDVFLREEVDGGLRGSALGIDMIAGNWQSQDGRESRHKRAAESSRYPNNNHEAARRLSTGIT